MNPMLTEGAAATGAANVHPEAGAGPLADHAILLVDSRAVIRHAGAGACRRLSYQPGDLVGRPLREVIPGLPLRSDTPGYNLAYLLFSYPGGGWHCAEALDGARRPIRIRLSLVPMDGRDGPRILICVDGSEVIQDSGQRDRERMIPGYADQLGVAPGRGYRHEGARAAQARETALR